MGARRRQNTNEHIKIPGHHTLCKAINTENSLLWVVDATFPKGHILWVYNNAKKEVAWVSSFEPSRCGVGQGTVNEHGDVQAKVAFEGEPENTYRKYSYTWVNDNEFVLKSTQFNSRDEPTGYFYGGTFVRINNVPKP